MTVTLKTNGICYDTNSIMQRIEDYTYLLKTTERLDVLSPAEKQEKVEYYTKQIVEETEILKRIIEQLANV